MSCCVDEEREARKDSPRSCNPNGKTLKPQFNELIYFSNDIIGTLWYGCTVAQVSVCLNFKLRTAILREWRKIHASNVRNKVAAIFCTHMAKTYKCKNQRHSKKYPVSRDFAPH